MAKVIETKGIKKIYKAKGIETYAVNGVNISIEEGEFLGIMGPSGSGKTTLLNLLSTIDMPTEGEVFFNGVNIATMKGKKLAEFRRKNIGFLFQDFNLLNNLSIMDNIALPLVLSGVKASIVKKKINELVSFFGLEKHLYKYPYQLSGGQKQRVAATRALITKPSVILADEPTGALDSKAASELLENLRKTNEKFGSTIVMVTHDAFTASYCDRIIFIKDGTVLTQLEKESDKKDLYKKILEQLACMGGINHELH
ncbi:peptide ABC transporter ATP-binding protein [Vallitalea longa]|uniref:Peptide ABC transporter ATP-binding protein n=1 Tax=Vallitalea longa TaxID=2936439 RepID=A0A9W5Y7V0_9FIRM|nr:ABC transporter ATP-binding protein [Vallitalea longa]GKX28257.1 peptide ABC transporter ATP-binding protein [Vallitalea longa]